MFSLIHTLLCLLLLNCIVDVFAVLKVMLGWNCYPSTKETHNLIQSHFLYDVSLTVWALSAAYIDCHCLTCSLSFSLSLFVCLWLLAALCYPLWWSSWRTQWLCKSRSWPAKASSSLAILWKRWVNWLNWQEDHFPVLVVALIMIPAQL